MTWWSWFAWCELIGESLYELLLVLWRTSEDAALAFERGFDESTWAALDEPAWEWPECPAAWE